TVPSSQTDSPEQVSRAASRLARCHRGHRMTRQLAFEFAELARERAERHPIRTYLWVPIERAAAMWFTPRITLLPYSGRLWPLAERYHNNPADFEVTLGLALLNVVYVGIALAAAWFWRTNPGVLLIATFIVVRTAFFTQ